MYFILFVTNNIVQGIVSLISFSACLSFVWRKATDLFAGGWIRISGEVSEDDNCVARELVQSAYPSLKQKYPGEQEEFLAVYQVHIEDVSVN